MVTAGHCVARATPKQVHVTLGDYVINSAVEPLPAYTFGVSQIRVSSYIDLKNQTCHLYETSTLAAGFCIRMSKIGLLQLDSLV